MAYEMRAGQGSAFVNKKKEQGDKRPDFTGKVMLPDGEVRWLSMWSKKTEAGANWMSVSVGDVVQQNQSTHDQSKSNGYQPQNVANMDDDVPF